MHGQQHAVEQGHAHRAGVDAAQDDGAAGLAPAISFGKSRVRTGRRAPSAQTPEDQQVVLGGVVVARGQLQVQQIGHMQLDELVAAQPLQGLLHLLELLLQRVAADGQPDKTLLGQLLGPV
jgi:hypothetical protein